MHSTKTLSVISTLINGHEQFVGTCSKHGMFPNKWNVNHTTDLHGYAKEFPSLEAADAFIPYLHNPHNRVYTAVEKVIEFKSKKERNDYERIL